VSERIRKILWNYGIRTAFKTVTSLANLLIKVNEPTKKNYKAEVIYKIMTNE